MNLELENKKVLITGASRGIGLSIAEEFLMEGASTLLISRGSDALSENANKLEKIYGKNKILAHKCDCLDVASLKKLKVRVTNQWNELDVVVANVGDGNSVPDALPSLDQWQKVWNNNFETALNTARVFLPMLEKSNGSLLFISSIAGLEAFGAPTDYSTAKSAVIALSKNLARKLAPYVRVNVIAPGNIYFKGGSWDQKINDDKKLIDNIIKSTVPMGRFGLPEEVAASAVFLSSAKAKFITGATIVIDGGQTLG